jgi:hypothetical protein
VNHAALLLRHRRQALTPRVAAAEGAQELVYLADPRRLCLGDRE